MQHEALPPFAGGAQLAVEIVLLPLRGDGRFLLGKARLHRKVGLGQEYGVFIVFGFGRVGHIWLGKRE
jgi:hypothetical protein